MKKGIEQKEGADISSLKIGLGNMTLRCLWPMIQGSLQPKYLRLFQQEVVPHLNPARLSGVFSRSNADRIVSPEGVWKGFYEIADIIGSQCFTPIQQGVRSQSANPNEPPFDLTMTVAHTYDRDAGPVESVPCNIAQIFAKMFDLEHEATRKIFNFISGRCNTGLAPTALILEIRGEYPHEIIEAINRTIEGWEMEYGYTSRVGNPPLSAALQSAISRVQTQEVIMRCAVTVTDTPGPDGKPIVVYSAQNRKIRLGEGEPDVMAFSPIRVNPTRNYLVREL